MHRVTVLAALALALLLAACSSQDPEVTAAEQVPQEIAEAAQGGGPSPGAGGGQVAATVEFTAVDIAYESVPGSTSAGNVQFVMTNEGAIQHNMHIEELGDQEVIPNIGGGAQGSGTAEVESGTITMYCSVAGHRAAGMEATLQAQ